MSFQKSVGFLAFGAALSLTSPLLEEIEGIRYRPYKDIAGIWTVCAGITGSDVVLGKTYTQRECDALLASISPSQRQRLTSG